MLYRNRRTWALLAVVRATCVTAPTFAQDQEDESAPAFEIELPDEEEKTIQIKKTVHVPQIDVIGEAPQTLRAVPNSATVITEEDLEQTAPMNTNEVLRTIPKIHILEEDSIDLRPNISIHGLNPMRSRNVLV